MYSVVQHSNRRKTRERFGETMSDKLARINWQMGQTLLPEHFVAQEESLLADTIARWRLWGLPASGIGALNLNDTLLVEGVLSLTSLTLVTNTGVLVDVPRNAVISPFNLNLPATASVNVYCHLLKDPAASDEQDYGGDEDGEEPSRMVHQLVLSSERGLSDAIETVKLGIFDKSPEGVWTLSRSYVPPLLRVGTSPYLKEQLEVLESSLEGFHYKLSQEIAASFLSGDALFTAKQCLKSVYRSQRFLANMKEQVRPHPYLVYEVLKELLTEICFFRSTVPEHVDSTYKHEDLAGCFKKIFDPLSEQMQLVQTKSPYLPFELQDGMYRCKLPTEIRQASDVYFLVQKSNVNKRVNVDDLKLSSFSRASLMHKLALVGCPLTRLDRPPFQHPFGPEVDFYQISPGEEWDHALRELSVAFYVAPGLEKTKFFIYWRSSG